MAAGIHWHPSSLAHDPGPGHPESPARIAILLERLRAFKPAAVMDWVEAEAVPEFAILRVHPRSHVERLRAVSAAGGGRLDADTAMSAGSFDAAVHAAGAALGAVSRALADGSSAFVPVRPPGHHATADTPMGFCLLNNVVIAARSAIDAHGLGRVLIVDWDVHHGNGTQALVERDNRIRYVSLHQWPLYPGTGLEHERGVGNVFNVPRPPGLPRERYVADLLSAVDRATDGWAPELILVSAGFDALAGDPLAGFTLEPADYVTWIGAWRALGAPIVSVLEGGYVPHRLADAALAHVLALA
ncbi:MAG: histone deacetylase [Gemmatimonadales bacterium]|jgi:acetoin utilization deacetylase AcuC-like enzyme|nr:histone deacetylase [Gemmatimonadales bacterium]